MTFSPGFPGQPAPVRTPRAWVAQFRPRPVSLSSPYPPADRDVALVVEESGVPQSMARSRGLIKGCWGRAATLVSYVALINLAAYIAVSLITGVVALIYGAGGSATSAVSQLLSLAADTLVAPLYPAVFVAGAVSLCTQCQGCMDLSPTSFPRRGRSSAGASEALDTRPPARDALLLYLNRPQ